MSELVSVVVPVYNVEKYINDCVDSIINQTYTDLEIILSDDGSPDRCGEICDEYASKDSRIKVIHCGNKGLSEARNRGIRIAAGEYITFVDSDDILNREFIQKLIWAVRKCNADIAVVGYQTFQKKSELSDDSSLSKDIVDIDVLSKKHLYDTTFLKQETMCLTVAWGKIYKRSLFENILYPISKLHEDTFTTYKLMYRAKKVVYLKEKLYYWRENYDSITRGTFTIRHLDILDALVEQLEFFHTKRKQRYVEIVFALYIENFFWCYNRMYERSMDMRLLRKYLDYMKEYLKHVKLTNSLGIKQWVRYRYLAWYKIPKLLVCKEEKRI